MKEKPVRETPGKDVWGLRMGLAALLSSVPVISFALLSLFSDRSDVYVYWISEGYIFSHLISLGFGLAGLILGTLSLKRHEGDSTRAWTGIILCGTAAVMVISFELLAMIGQ